MVERYFKFYNGGDNKAPWAVDRKLISHKVIDDTVYQCEGDEELISETLSDKVGKKPNNVYSHLLVGRCPGGAKLGALYVRCEFALAFLNLSQ